MSLPINCDANCDKWIKSSLREDVGRVEDMVVRSERTDTAVVETAKYSSFE
jgi:hypothetical protein